MTKLEASLLKFTARMSPEEKKNFLYILEHPDSDKAKRLDEVLNQFIPTINVFQTWEELEAFAESKEKSGDKSAHVLRVGKNIRDGSYELGSVTVKDGAIVEANLIAEPRE